MQTVHSFAKTRLETNLLTELGPVESFPAFDESLVKDLPVHVRARGTKKEPRLPHHWMNYELRADRKALGSLGFMRTASVLFPQLYITMCRELLKHFNLDVNQFRPNKMSLIRTTGELLPHTDEERGSCVTIGLLNSKVAITQTSSDPDPTKFETTHERYQAKDGIAYAMNAQALHGFYSQDLQTYRYLLTYSFKRSYQDLMATRRKPT